MEDTSISSRLLCLLNKSTPKSQQDNSARVKTAKRNVSLSLIKDNYVFNHDLRQYATTIQPTLTSHPEV
jgi:hypothetical protein